MPYKDYSSLLRWQANMCSYIETTELCWQRYIVVFDERLVPDLLRGRGRLIGGDLNVGEEGFEQTIVTLQ
jgi:hypothetical protein